MHLGFFFEGLSGQDDQVIINPEHRILIRIKILIWWGSNINIRYWFLKGKYQSKKEAFWRLQIKSRIKILQKGKSRKISRQNQEKYQEANQEKSLSQSCSCMLFQPWCACPKPCSLSFPRHAACLFQEMLHESFSKISPECTFSKVSRKRYLFQDTNPPHCPTQVPPCSWSTGNGKTTYILSTAWSSPLWMRLQSWCYGPFWRFFPQSLPLWNSNVFWG